MDRSTIAVLKGDETGQELLEEALRVLSADVVDIELELVRSDLSLANRRATRNGAVFESAAAIRDGGLGLKAATITPEGRDDVGSPNRILCDGIGGAAIVRTGRQIPGAAPFGDDFEPDAVMAEAAHGTAPLLRGEGTWRTRWR